jgi:hypothetical protein
MLEDKPRCVSCELYVVTFHGTSEAEIDGERRIICRTCSSKSARVEYESIEALRKDTRG